MLKKIRVLNLIVVLVLSFTLFVVPFASAATPSGGVIPSSVGSGVSSGLKIADPLSSLPLTVSWTGQSPSYSSRITVFSPITLSVQPEFSDTSTPLSPVSWTVSNSPTNSILSYTPFIQTSSFLYQLSSLWSEGSRNGSGIFNSCFLNFGNSVSLPVAISRFSSDFWTNYYSSFSSFSPFTNAALIDTSNITAFPLSFFSVKQFLVLNSGVPRINDLTFSNFSLSLSAVASSNILSTLSDSTSFISRVDFYYAPLSNKSSTSTSLLNFIFLLVRIRFNTSAELVFSVMDSVKSSQVYSYSSTYLSCASGSPSFPLLDFNALFDPYYLYGTEYNPASNYTDALYGAGYNNGFTDGQNFVTPGTPNYQAGYDSAQSVVNKDSASYNAGFTAGVASANDYSFLGLMGAVVDAPLTAFTSLFNVNILGVNMLDFVSAILTLCLVLFIVKLFL